MPPVFTAFRNTTRRVPGCEGETRRGAAQLIRAPRKGVSEQQEAFRSSKNRIRCKGVCGGLHRSESGAVFTAFRNAVRGGWGTCVVQYGRAPCDSLAASLRRKPGERGHRSIM